MRRVASASLLAIALVGVASCSGRLLKDSGRASASAPADRGATERLPADTLPDSGLAVKTGSQAPPSRSAAGSGSGGASAPSPAPSVRTEPSTNIELADAQVAKADDARSAAAGGSAPGAYSTPADIEERAVSERRSVWGSLGLLGLFGLTGLLRRRRHHETVVAGAADRRVRIYQTPTTD